MSELEWSPPDRFEEYRLVQPLGRGAMGLVYLAHDSLLDRPVAVKFPRAAEDPDVRERFFVEARAIARLQHPNVVAIYRASEVGGHPYLVSEYVRGRALDQLQWPVPWRQVLAIAIDLTRGLAAAHRCGVLHRDVKPANAMITDDGRAKLLDFGLAVVVDGGVIEEPVMPPRLERATSPRSERPKHHLAALDAMETVSAFHPEPLTLGNGTPNARIEGTPLYAAPEIWEGEPATRRSDLYSLGILLYELVAGAAPHRGIPAAQLAEIVKTWDVPRLGDLVPDVDPGFAAIIDRLVERDAGARFPSADALLVALEEMAAPRREDDVPDGNPYRGLAAFDSAHGSLFFGRRGEIRELVDRVRAEPLVIVGGDSGTGKSSVCRAGVLPWLVEHDGWTRVDIVPGRKPVRALAAALAPWCGRAEDELEKQFEDSPDDTARTLRQSASDAPSVAFARGSGVSRTSAPRKLLVFVDQLEELHTLSDPADARVFARALAAIGQRSPSVRVLATARSDYLSRLAMLPGLGDDMSRGLYFLRPLAGDRIREAIVRPAAAQGVRFESDTLVDTLVEQTENAPGGLPLLQFTLAELWDARDVETRTIPSDALAALGGVAGALTRHADRILAGLDANGRESARQILLRLVTAEGTRARRSAGELLRERTDRAALEVLVRGRIVVANDAQDGAYEIAHEALLASWSTLNDWLEQTAADHAVRRRVEQAAAEWERAGEPRDLLWSRRKLVEARPLDRSSLAPREAAFLAAGHRAIVRTRILVAAGLVAVAAGTIATGTILRARARHELERVIAGQLTDATTSLDSARTISRERDAVRTQAFARFDAHDWSAGEDAWAKAEELGLREAGQYRAASSHLENALALDPTRTSLREQLADLLTERLQRAQRDRHTELADELAGRLAAYDSGHRASDLATEAQIELDVAPGTTVYREHGDTRMLVGTAPLPALHVPPGALVLAFEAPGRAPAHMPVLAGHGEKLKLSVALPPAASVPDGMIYVPAGRFLFGSADSSDLRRGFLNSPPMHEVAAPAFLIARHEVTYGEWIAFLDDLSPSERAARTPSSQMPQSAVTLTEVAPKKWRYTFVRGTKTYVADQGARIHYDDRKVRADQDWLKFPVAAISYEDALAYAAWLDRTKRLPGARVCDEYEWERAARGADGRTWPTGETLGGGDANIDVTYGRLPLAFGPDEVGSHPRSRSPVGADDMAGNAWEWTRSVETTENSPIARGGGWYNEALSARSTNREPAEPTQRHVWIGLRMCANPPLSEPTPPTVK
ncbi:MAG: SUMF1/EgtB/PvdO family nonheme iron enzyme [Kofleriaceae bacterium]|nr:SUMF1/EgtB/PvdO family nonheme iron enzyme [Kofleriaceae bacterium]